MPAIVARGLGYSTPDNSRPLQQGLSFSLEPGHLLWIRGPNGCGKSTLLDVLGGRHPHTGILEISVPRSQIAIVPQMESSSLHVPLTLGDFVRLSIPTFTGTEPWVQTWFPKSFQGLRWNTASGGERRRALLVRALAAQPKLLFLDEPMNHLDSHSRQVILALLCEFLKDSEHPGTAVLVSHEESTQDLHRMQIPFSEVSLRGAHP